MSERSAIGRYIFPVMIIAALIWLALQTLGGGSSHQGFRFSDALAFARQGAGIDHVTFHPSTQEVDFHLVSGKTRTSVYPLDQSGYELQQLLESKHIPFDAKRRGSSTIWALLTGILPFVLLFGFWVFLMRNVKRGEPGGPSSPRTSF
jgi:ATP-dependent Zn protease